MNYRNFLRENLCLASMKPLKAIFFRWYYLEGQLRGRYLIIWL